MSRNAEKRAFSEFKETCPRLDSILDTLDRDIKGMITEPFRQALITAYEEVEDLEEKVADLEEKVVDLEAQVETLSIT